jgi:hypothetical protein
MLGATRAALLGAGAALPPAPAPGIELQGAWALDEPAGTEFADAIAGNTATLVDPRGNATHLYARPALADGGAGSLMLSDQYLEIPMIAAYQQAAVSLVIYLQPFTFMRGRRHFQSDRPDLAGFETLWWMGSEDGAVVLKRVERGLRGGIWQGGSVTWFGGADADVAPLAEDAAHRIVVTQGPDGARLYIGDTEVAQLPGVTLGWSGITHPIRIGRQNGDLRPPVTCLGAMVGDVRIYAGQLLGGEIALLPAPRTLHVRPSDPALPRPYSKPAALAALPTFVLEDQAGATPAAKLQAAIDAANAAGGGWVTQADPSTPITATFNDVKPRVNVHFWELNLRRANESYGFWHYMFLTDTTQGFMGGHGSTQHYYIGCKFDGNILNQRMKNIGNPGNRQLDTADPDYDTLWPGANSPDSTEAKRWHFEQAHIFYVSTSQAGKLNLNWEWCDFSYVNGEGVSINLKVDANVNNCRFHACRRGSVIQNGGDDATAWMRRCEVDSQFNGKTGPVIVAGALQDTEPFGQLINMFSFDCWGSGQWKWDGIGNTTTGDNGTMRAYNTHMAEDTYINLVPAGNVGRPVNTLAIRGSTLRYSRPLAGSGLRNVLLGTQIGNTSEGILFEDVLFVCSGNFTSFSGQYHTFTSSTPLGLLVSCSWGPAIAGAKVVFRRCRFETENLPAGLSAANIWCLDVASGHATRFEFESCTLANGFAQDRPFRFSSSNQTVAFLGAGLVRDDGRANANLLQGTWTAG